MTTFCHGYDLTHVIDGGDHIVNSLEVLKSPLVFLTVANIHQPLVSGIISMTLV